MLLSTPSFTSVFDLSASLKSTESTDNRPLNTACSTGQRDCTKSAITGLASVPSLANSALRADASAALISGFAFCRVVMKLSIPLVDSMDMVAGSRVGGWSGRCGHTKHDSGQRQAPENISGSVKISCASSEGL